MFDCKKKFQSMMRYFGIEIEFVSRRLSLRRLYSKIAHIEGDIVECGIGKMHTFRMLASLLRNEKSARKLWGFDSFEGFPEISKFDESVRNLQKGEWKVINENDVHKFLFILGFDEEWIRSHIKIVKGFFKDSLPKSDVEHIAFLHLDVDLYESYKICLQYLFPKVMPGGIVLFDEYHDSIKLPGAKKGVDEYFQGTDYHLQQDKLTSKYYVIKKL